MVNHAKHVALNPRDQGSANQWRDSNDRLLDSVRSVGDAITGIPQPNQYTSSVNNNYHQPSQAPPLQPSNYYQHRQAQNSTPSHQPYHHVNVIESLEAKAPSPPIVHNRLVHFFRLYI